MATISDVQRDVARNLQQITDSFIEDDFRKNLAFIGTVSTPTPFTETPTNDGSIGFFANTLLKGYTGFSNVYRTQINTSATQISYRNMMSNLSYADTNIASISNNLRGFVSNKQQGVNSSNIEISLRNLVNNTNTSGTLSHILNKNRILYSILDDVNYKNYIYRLSNPDATTVVVNARDYRGTEITYSTSSQINQIKDMIQELKSVSSTISTKDFTQSSKRTLSNLANPSVSTTVPLPSQVKSDDVVFVRPNAGLTASAEAYISFDVATSQTTSGTRFYTVSFFAKTDATGGNLQSSSLVLDMTLSDNGGTKHIQTLNIPYYERMEFPITNTWKQYSFTRKISIPDTNPYNFNVVAKLSIDHEGITSDKHAILFTGVQTITQTVDPKGVLPIFKPPQFDDSRTNRFVIRRLLLLYELLATYYIAVRFLIAKSKNERSINNHARNLVNLVYEYITNYNRNLVRSGSTNDNYISNIGKSVSNQVSKYNEQSKDINDKATLLKDNQYVLRGKVNSLTGEKQISSESNNMRIIAFVLFIIVTVASLIAYALPISGAQKVSICAGIAALAIIVLLVFNFVFVKQVEPFQTANLLTSPSTFDTGNIVSNSAQYELDSSYIALSFANDYLDNTINIALMMQTYVGYGKINQSLAVERDYYGRVNSQIENSKYSIANVKNSFALDKYTYRAQVSFMVSVGILIALTSALLVAYPNARVFTLIVASIILLIAILFYFLDTSVRVRTSSEKHYWGTPNTQNL
jgi:hypothetical protein